MVLAALAGACRLEFDQAVVDAGDHTDAGTDAERCAPHVVELGAGQDDGELYEASFYPDGEGGRVLIGYWGSGPTWGYFRFRLPASGRVTQAALRLFGEGTDGTWDPGVMGVRIFAELGASPVVTGAADQPFGTGGRPVTASHVRWPAAGGLSWPTGDWIRSPDLAPLFVERGPAVEGTFVQLWLDGDFAAGLAEVGTRDRGSDATRAARLELTICAP